MNRPDLNTLAKEEDFYLEEPRCQRCDIEISHEEDNNNLGLCNECYKESRL